MTLGGEQLSFKSPREALAHGIVTIVQELAIVPGLTVAENVYLGVEATTADSCGAVSLDVVFASSRRRWDLICRRIVAREAIDRRPTKSGNHASALSQRFNRRHGRADGRTFGKRDRRPPRDHPVPGA